MQIGEHLDFFESDAQCFIEVVRTSDLAASVPGCPGWQLRDLALHLGTVHRWAKACIESNDALPRVESPIEDALLCAWLDEGFTDLAGFLRAADPQRKTWTFGPEPRLTSFWFRRQAHEASVHLWDARSAVGFVEPIDEHLAADGVAEVFEVFIPRELTRGRMQYPDEGVRIVLADGRSFNLGERIVGEVSGSSSDILLALWHRLPTSVLTTDTDAEVLETAFARALTS